MAKNWPCMICEKRYAELEEAEVCERRHEEPARDAWDELYERQAARDRLNGFDRTGGKDWT